MKINDLKDLEKTIKLCRKLGVDIIKVGDVEFHLGTQPSVLQSRTRSVQRNAGTSIPTDPSIITEDTKILGEELTDEQKLFWSAVDPTEPTQVEQ